MRSKLILWFDSLSVGSFITSGAFYLAYDQWRPMVWVAVVICVIKMANNFVNLMDNS